jgi:hypothetical protein
VSLRLLAGRDHPALKAMGLWPNTREDAVPWSPPAPQAPIPITEGVARIWRETAPAPGTLVDLWLKHRGIRWAIPPAIRFHSGSVALTAVAQNLAAPRSTD